MTTASTSREPGKLLASRRSAIAPFMVMDVMERAAQIEAAGGHVVHLEVGQPAAPAPRTAREAAARLLESGQIGYTTALGLPAVRQRIARHYAETAGLAIDPARIVLTTGSSAGFVLAFLSLFEPGDRVAIASPGYPPYRHTLTALGCEPVLLPTDASTRWSLTPRMLEEAHRRAPLKGVLVASPANPTGTMMTREALSDLIAAAHDMGIRFISDEIYHGLDYAFPAVTGVAISDEVTVINSFSKYFCMTGWRVGWMVVPPDLVRAVERLQQNLSISVPTLSQVAAQAAFDGTAEMDAVKATYVENRGILANGLPGIGIDQFLPVDGAFYLYANVGQFTQDSPAFARRILDEALVAVTPGVDFDPFEGHHYLRLSYAGSAADMRLALERLGAFLKKG
jgi:aspartate/methionine/tyrosine aminotransferase